MRILRWGSRGEDVRALQQKLKDLAYYSGVVDGWYGYQTESALRRYQLAKGLRVDGIAGPETLQALGLTGVATPSLATPSTTSPVGGANRAVSLHIGVNRVDPAGYGGWSGPLSGCEADANTMRAIAQAEGLATNTLKTSEATTGDVLASIAQIAGALQAEDFFLLTYAGHGGQMPNGNSDPEADSMDETWCLYDRQLLDDEIETALAAFRPGVNIVLLSDSCHSGTIYRYVAAQPPQRDLDRERSYASLKEAYYVDLEAGRPGPNDPLFDAVPRPRQTAVPVLIGAGMTSATTHVSEAPNLDLDDNGRGGSRSYEGGDIYDGVVTRAIPLDRLEPLWTSQRVMYQQIRQRLASRGIVQANGLSISGCADNQLSQEFGGAGVFTTILNRVWNGNSFRSSYEAFHKAIVSNMAPSQTPELGMFGANPQKLLAMTPFDR